MKVKTQEEFITDEKELFKTIEGIINKGENK